MRNYRLRSKLKNNDTRILSVLIEIRDALRESGRGPISQKIPLPVISVATPPQGALASIEPVAAPVVDTEPEGSEAPEPEPKYIYPKEAWDPMKHIKPGEHFGDAFDRFQKEIRDSLRPHPTED